MTCTGPECDRTDIYATGLCISHYSQKMKHKPLTPIRKPQPKVLCEGPECDREATAANPLCKAHRSQLTRGPGYLRPLMKRAPRGPNRGMVAKVGDQCIFDGCGRLTRSPATGLCPGHLTQRKDGKELRPLRDKRRKKSPHGNLPAGWFDTTVEKPRNPGNGPGGTITHDTIGLPLTITADQYRNAALAAVTRGRTPAERRALLDMLGITEHITNQKAS